MPDRQIEQDGVGQLVMSRDASANLAANSRKSCRRPSFSGVEGAAKRAFLGLIQLEVSILRR